MNTIQITAKKIEIAQDIREEIKEKLNKLKKFNHRIQAVEIVVKAEEHKILCETIVRLDHHGSIIIEVAGETIQGAVDVAIDKCERQLRKDKERESVRRRQGSAGKGEDHDPH